MQPWPVASTHWRRGGATESEPVRLIVHATEPLETRAGPAPGEVIEADGDRFVIAAGEGAVRILTLQREGKRPGPVADFLNGNRVAPGDRMGDGPSPAL
jgi:methionyl-tRNA formyltransferase